MNCVARTFFGLLIFFSSAIALADCTSPTGLSGAILWDSTANKMKVCSGTMWVDTLAAAGGACAVTNGTTNYSSGDIRYCYNNTWYSMKGTSINSCSGTLAGSFRYDSSLSTYKFCNGNDNNWYRMTAPPSGRYHGYFVMTHTTYNGNFKNGYATGLAGANDKCLTALTTNNWLGKNEAGTLNSSRVEAFLCDSTKCQNPNASSTYVFSHTNTSGVNTAGNGGATLRTNASSQGPGDNATWLDTNHFGTGTYDWAWTGRKPGTDPLWWPLSYDPADPNTCTDWTINAGPAAHDTRPGGTSYDRWSGGYADCGDLRMLICMVHPDDKPKNDCTGSCKEILITNPATNVWTVPADWNDSNNKIEVIGAGGGARSGISNTHGGGGGGGGGYAYATNVDLTPGVQMMVAIGAGGAGGSSPTHGGNTFFGGSELADSIAGVWGGQAASANNIGGIGGIVERGTGFTGGAGGNGFAGARGGGGGGGGAAGPLGAGGSGGTTGVILGAGGGGNGGGTAGGAPHATDLTLAGAGGKNKHGFGIPAKVTTATQQSGFPGFHGGGGGGCTGGGATIVNAGAGSMGLEFGTYGSGGGGGGGCGGATNGNSYNGAAGGTYGGGGGGGAAVSQATKTPGVGGNGGGGMIRITYTP